LARSNPARAKKIKTLQLNEIEANIKNYFYQ